MARFRVDFFRNPRLAVLLLLVVMILTGLYYFRAVLLPFALAIFLSYLLAPVITWIHQRQIRKRNTPRGAAVLGVYVIMIGLIVLSGYFIFPRFYVEVNNMVKTLPAVLKSVEKEYIVPLESKINKVFAEIAPTPAEAPVLVGLDGKVSNGANNHDKPRKKPTAHGKTARVGKEPPPWQALVENYTYEIKRLNENSFEVVPRKRETPNGEAGNKPFRFNRQLTGAFDQFSKGVKDNILGFIQVGQKFVRGVLGSVFTLFLVLMISGFILIDPSRIVNFGRSLIPVDYQVAFDDWLNGLDYGLSGVVRGQAIICLVNGALTGIGIAALGVPFVVTLSIIAAVFSLIPIFGVLMSSIPILLMALTVSFTTALLSLAWILLVHFIEGNFLNPKIMGDSAKIHPVLIVFALMVGEHFAGVMGALLAVPIFSLIQNSFLFLKTRAENLDIA